MADDIAGSHQDSLPALPELLAVLDVLDDGITLQDPTGRLCYANTAAAQLLGYPSGAALVGAPPAEILDKFEVLDEDGRPLGLDHIPGRLVRGGAPSAEAVVRFRVRASGAEHLRLVRATAICDGHGQLQVVVNVFRDITEQHHSAQEREVLLARLATERSQLEAVLQQLPTGVIIAEAPSGRLVLGNQQAAQIWRQPFLAAATVDEYAQYQGFHLDGRPYAPHEWPLARAITTGAVVVREQIVFVRGDGSFGTMEASAAPIRDRAGQIVAGVVAFDDISERTAAEAQIRRLLAGEQAERQQAELAQRRLAFLAEASQVLAASLAYEQTLESVVRLVVPQFADYCTLHLFDEDGAITPVAVAHVDPAKEALIHEIHRRYPPGRQHPGNWNSLTSGEAMVLHDMPAAMLDSIAYDTGHRAMLEQLGTVSGLLVPLQVRGRMIGVLALGSAESGWRHTSDDLQLATELGARIAQAVDNARLYHEAQQAIQLRDLFFSVAAHELKTPLTTLQGQAQRLLRRAARGGALPDPDRRTVEQIASQTQRLNDMVAALLDVARLQQHQLSLDRKRFDLHLLLRHLVDELQPTLERHTLALELCAGPLRVYGDPLRLEQVFQNLLSNAVKYSPGGGAVLIASTHADGAAHISVRDSGIGIPAAAIPHLFRRFYRADNGQRVSGMGIGLYIVHEIIALHSGQISVSSAEGQGSVFTVTLPLDGSEGHGAKV